MGGPTMSEWPEGWFRDGQAPDKGGDPTVNIPASQSRPSASKGAGLTALAQRVMRSPTSAAQARACGPPPEAPQIAKRSQPR